MANGFGKYKWLIAPPLTGFAYPPHCFVRKLPRHDIDTTRVVPGASEGEVFLMSSGGEEFLPTARRRGFSLAGFGHSSSRVYSCN